MESAEISTAAPAAPKSKRERLEDGLPHFTGTENWYRHLFGMIYTDGVRFVAETAGAYWLIDLVASYQPALRQRGIDPQFWTLTVDLAARSAVIHCREDSDCPPCVTQEIEYTDFPLPTFELWVENTVILLPSEH